MIIEVIEGKPRKNAEMRKAYFQELKEEAYTCPICNYQTKPYKKKTHGTKEELDIRNISRNSKNTKEVEELEQTSIDENRPKCPFVRNLPLLYFRNIKWACRQVSLEGGSAWGLSFSDSWGLSFSDSWGLSFSDSWGLSFSIKNTKKYQKYTIKTRDLLDLLGCVFVFSG